MKQLVIFFLAGLLSFAGHAHDVHYAHGELKRWELPRQGRHVIGSFTVYKNGTVYVLDAHDSLISMPFDELTESDQSVVLKKTRAIDRVNSQSEVNNSSKSATKVVQEGMFSAKDSDPRPEKFSIVALIALLLLFFTGIVLWVQRRKKVGYFTLLVSGAFVLLAGFGNKHFIVSQFTTSPAFIDSAFFPFKPHVNTYWDPTYFYVESKGIPTTHGMMVGISNHGWQQQVPIPQCYIGTNAWPIPLNPVMAANPIPVDSIHFTRGAIAIAANGVPIFNVHTNTGVDSYLDGQLDNYGGHCGRADDYHYHIAPLHLYNYTSTSLPCAFGLDGFPVYGNVEPDGAAVQPLDSNNGHFYGNMYHYHGVASAPYMIARMAGVVTEDATHQLIPQAAANPVRPALTPLNGALITGCTPNPSNTGYTVTYTLNGQTDSIVYYWNMSGLYTFNFYTAGNGTATTQNYTDFIQCMVPTLVPDQSRGAISFDVFPNPNKGVFQVVLSDGIHSGDIHSVALYDLKGRKHFESRQFTGRIAIESLQAGVYILQLELAGSHISRKVIIQANN